MVPVCTQTPPIVLFRSTIATFLRNVAAQIAAFWLAGPLPITTRSYSLASIVLPVQETPKMVVDSLKRLRSVAQSPRNYHYFSRKRSGLLAVTIFSQSRGTMTAIGRSPLPTSRLRLDDPRNYFNRHESWLAFNRRVLEEAQDEGNPLLERVKFLGITASNLDEFIEVRVAGLLQQAEHGNQLAGPDGLSPEEQLQRLVRELHAFVASQYECWNQKLVPALVREGIRILPVAHLDHAGRDAMDLFFVRQVDPLLTPVTIDPSHPFPHVINKALCVAFSLRQRRRPSTAYLGVVTVPRKLPRLVRVPAKRGDEAGRIDYVFLHDLIEEQTG